VEANYREFYALAKPILTDPRYKQLRSFIQHGKITTYAHCRRVAWYAFCLNRRFDLGADEENLVKAALLHDYYLYDWHSRGDHLHGFHHPGIAAEKAAADFLLDEEVLAAIRSHMWPLNLLTIPDSKVAWLLTVSDKICSSYETLFEREKKPKEKREKVGSFGGVRAYGDLFLLKMNRLLAMVSRSR